MILSQKAKVITQTNSKIATEPAVGSRRKQKKKKKGGGGMNAQFVINT